MPFVLNIVREEYDTDPTTINVHFFRYYDKIDISKIKGDDVCG